MVLSRKPGETFIIDNLVRVTVLDIRDGKLRCQIDAPRDVAVQREELLPETRDLVEMEYGVGD